MLVGDQIRHDRYKLIAGVHNSQVGHHGRERTLARLAHIPDWPSKRQDVTEFLRLCPCCQMMARIKIPIQTYSFTVGTYAIMDRLNIDTIGPLPEDERGNKYVIVIIDAFSRFIELRAAKDATGKSAARAILSFIGRY